MFKSAGEIQGTLKKSGVDGGLYDSESGTID
jgi:hypothetical protein